MAETTKSLTELKRLTGRALVELVNQGDVVIKYTGDKVARLTRYSEATPPQTPESTQVPAQILDLTNWYLTLPTSEKCDPDTIKQPDLAKYSSEYMHANERGNAVVFRVYHGGSTTANSKNPRSELREMKNSGKDKAAWSSTSGRHTMRIAQRITHLTTVKPHVVLGQIHDSEDDVTVFRLEGSKLWITDGDNTHGYLLTDSYKLGTLFSVGFDVSDGKIRYYFNDELVPYTQTKKFNGAYFKCGNYLQSNPSTAPGESTSAYAEVEVLGLQVSHEA